MTRSVYTPIHKRYVTVGEAAYFQRRSYLRTLRFNKLGICEVCFGKHQTYVCCERCNYDRHMCHFCGDSLGHSEVSACYFVEVDLEMSASVWTSHIIEGPERREFSS